MATNHRVRQVGKAAAVMAVLMLAGVARAGPETEGQWSALENWPISTTHTHLLPNGKVFVWGEYDDGYKTFIWDPATDQLTPQASPSYNIFCGGHTLLGDGRLFEAGGHVASHVGFPNASIYDPASNTWTDLPEMNDARWYPSAITLPNGDAFVVSGEIADVSDLNPIHQVFEVATGTWRDLTGAAQKIAYYPRMFVGPDGRVFIAGTKAQTWWIDTAGAGTIVKGPVSAPSDGRDYGPAVMYDEGKIILIGGGDTPVATTELIDLKSPNPTWIPGQPMSSPRRQHNATLLPDGTILVTGGSSGSDFNDRDASVPFAELWDPKTGGWTVLATAAVFRGYHSTGVLLPDGRVFNGGGRGAVDNTAQVFSPPYLFKGPRPTITAAPDKVWPAAQFKLSTPNADDVQTVTLIRLGSVTHSFNMNQRLLNLTFTRAAGSLIVDGPRDNNAAPMGHYMLFIVDGAGVPSVGKIVQVVYGPTAGPAPRVDVPIPPIGADAGVDADGGSDAGTDADVVAVPVDRSGDSGGGCSSAGGAPILATAAAIAIGLWLSRRAKE